MVKLSSGPSNAVFSPLWLSTNAQKKNNLREVFRRAGDTSLSAFVGKCPVALHSMDEPPLPTGAGARAPGRELAQAGESFVLRLNVR